MKALKITDLMIVGLFIIGILVGFIQSENTHENIVVVANPQLISLIKP